MDNAIKEALQMLHEKGIVPDKNFEDSLRKIGKKGGVVVKKAKGDGNKFGNADEDLTNKQKILELNVSYFRILYFFRTKSQMLTQLSELLELRSLHLRTRSFNC